MKDCDWILASASPRRVELLKTLIPSFQIIPSNIEEVFDSSLSVIEQATELAEQKAIAVSKQLGARPEKTAIIGADTIVALDEEVFGKPLDHKDAVRILTLLSGKTHRVVTGVSVISPDKTISFWEETFVTFRTLTHEEILDYVATDEPYDKAGAYAIQGGAASFVAQISGDVNNVIGLPISRLAQEMRSL